MTTTNTDELRSTYRKLAAACGVDMATFNGQVERLLCELDDGEPPRRSPSRYVEAAKEVAYYEYKVDHRTL